MRYEVRVRRLLVFEQTVEVEAPDELKAIDRAEETAEDDRFEWGEATDDSVEVDSCEEVPAPLYEEEP